MKYIKKFNTLNENLEDQLKIGIKIESEHGDVYEYLDNYLEPFNIKMPFTRDEFYKKIAEAHLREMPDYYTRLIKMEKE